MRKYIIVFTFILILIHWITYKNQKRCQQKLWNKTNLTLMFWNHYKTTELPNFQISPSGAANTLVAAAQSTPLDGSGEAARWRHAEYRVCSTTRTSAVPSADPAATWSAVFHRSRDLWRACGRSAVLCIVSRSYYRQMSPTPLHTQHTPAAAVLLCTEWNDCAGPGDRDG